MSGFAGGFSQGWSQGAQRANLYQQLGIQKADQALREKQFTVQQDQFNRDLQLRTRNQDLQQRQEERLAQHQDFTQKLQAKTQEIQLRQQDLEEVKQVNGILKLAEGGNVELASAALDVYAIKLGIDPKGAEYKAIQKMILAMPAQSIADLQNFFTKMTPSMDAGSATVLAKYFLTNPEGALKMGESLMAHQAALASAEAAKAQADAPVQFGRPVTPDFPSGTEFGTRTSVVGKPGPPRQNILSPAEQIEVEGKKGVQVSALKYADEVYKAADDTLAIVPHVDTLRAIAGDQSFVTGVAGNARYAIGKWAEFLGINMAEVDKMFPGLAKAIGDPAQAEAAKQAQGFIAEKVAQSMSRLTNIQFSFVQGVVPGLMTTPEGTLIFADLQDRFADRARRIKKLYNKYEAKGDFTGFKAEKDDLDLTDPIIDDALMKRILRVTKGVPGMGINLPAAAAAAAEAAGKTSITIPDVGKFPIITQRTKTALPVIQTARGNMPYVETAADLDLLEPGTIFFSGPDKQLAVKEAKPEATKPAPTPAPTSTAKPGANSVVRIK